MTKFIRVIGSDPFYESLKTYMFVSIHSIQKVCPVYATRDSHGKQWRCAAEDDRAALVLYQLTDLHGQTYSCDRSDALERLGIVEPQRKPKIGFVKQKDGDSIPVATEETERGR